MVILRILLVVCFYFYGIYADECRQVQWRTRVPNKALRGHVLQNVTTSSASSCESHCFDEPDCHSYNFNPINLKCQLSSSSDEAHPSYIKDCSGCTYRAIKNNCVGNPCNANFKCQSGYGGIKLRRCVCEACFKGSNCQKGNFIMKFPEVPHKDAIKYRYSGELRQFIVTCWVQTTTSLPEQYVLSFATPTVTNAFAIILMDTTKIMVGVRSEYREFSATITNGKWHHVGVQWNKDDGSLKTFVDGVLKDHGPVAASFQMQDPYIVIGQDQDNYGGDFAEDQRFSGNITDFNIYSLDFDYDIVRLAQNCPSGEGNILKSVDLLSYIEGGIEKECPAVCGPT